MDKKITIKNVRQFFEGNLLLLGDKLNLLDAHTREQVEYRASICYESCFKGNEGRCEKCGCKVPGKWYVKESCNNGEKFPDLMSKEDWEVYKQALEVKNIIDANRED